MDIRRRFLSKKSSGGDVYSIMYTSSDGNVVTPYTKTVFGANITSNTYINGQGIIIFDSPVTSIGYKAFYDCTSLTSVTIPDSVTELGQYTFQGCTSLTSVTIPDSVTSIEQYAFIDCSSLTSVTIGNSVTSIRSSAFHGCKSLTSITIPDSVSSIGVAAFNGCNNITHIVLGASITELSYYAFECIQIKEIYCKALNPPKLYYYSKDGRTSIYRNNNMKIYVPQESYNLYTSYSGTANGGMSQQNWSLYKSYIQPYDFEDDGESGGDVDIDTTYSIMYTSSDRNVVTPYATNVFGANITSNTYVNGQGIIAFDNPVTQIGDKAFYSCQNITNITIPNNVTSIGNYAFEYCYSLQNISIPNSVTSIGSYAFNDCDSLTSVTIGDGVVSIGENAFKSCGSLTSVTIGDDVTSIGTYAFRDCTSLTSVYCKATTPPTMGEYSSVFIANASGRIIYVPTASVSAYKSAPGWKSYASSIVGYDFEDDGESSIILTPNATTDDNRRAYELINSQAVFDGVMSYDWVPTTTNLLISGEVGSTTLYQELVRSAVRECDTCYHIDFESLYDIGFVTPIACLYPDGYFSVYDDD